MAATDTPSLITDLMAAALTWTGEHAQEHRELVTKLYAAAKSESKVALEELARLWGEAEKARQDLHALQHQYVLLHQSQNVAVPVGEQKISTLPHAVGLGQSGVSNADVVTRQPAKVLGKEKTQVTPSIDLTGDDTNTGDRASVDKPTHPLLQQSGVPEANPAIATSQDPQLTLEPRPVVKRERSPSADAGDSPSPAKRPSNGTGRRPWDGEVEPQRAVKGFNLPETSRAPDDNCVFQSRATPANMVEIPEIVESLMAFAQELLQAKREVTVQVRRIQELEEEVQVQGRRIHGLEQKWHNQTQQIQALTLEKPQLKLLHEATRPSAVQTPPKSPDRNPSTREKNLRIKAARSHRPGFVVLPRKDKKNHDIFDNHIFEDSRAGEAYSWRADQMKPVDLRKAKWKLTRLPTPERPYPGKGKHEDEGAVSDSAGSPSGARTTPASQDLKMSRAEIDDDRPLPMRKDYFDPDDPRRIFGRYAIGPRKVNLKRSLPPNDPGGEEFRRKAICVHCWLTSSFCDFYSQCGTNPRCPCLHPGQRDDSDAEYVVEEGVLPWKGSVRVGKKTRSVHFFLPFLHVIISKTPNTSAEMKTSGVLALASILSNALAQFVPAPTDLITTKGFLDLPVRYKEVPEGICELTPGVKSYSGYVDVAEQQSIFWWFFEARNQDPTTAPLTVWINGGPGSSSMIGLFQELGPCGIDGNGSVVYNEYAWNNVSNMLFIDHPAQVGFSYSLAVPAYRSDASPSDIVQLPNATCPDYAAGLACGTYSTPNASDTSNSTQAAAPSMYKTLQGFFGAFPQYSRHEFNFATESYGGHYGPVFNEYLEEQNALIKAGKLPGAHSIKLSTLLIGNGWYDPLIQYQAYYNFSIYPGNTYDYDVYKASTKAMIYNSLYGPGNCYDMTIDCYTSGLNDICSAADAFCFAEVENQLDIIAVRDEYDIREPYNDPFPYPFFIDYLNTPKVQQALGAFVNYSESSSTVGTAFTTTGDDDRESGTIEDVQKLLKQGVYFVQYTGDADYNCNWLGGEVVSEMIGGAGFVSAGYTNITTSDDIVHGQVKQSGSFAFVRIYESGHEVPFYQPLAALQMFERAICGLDIADGAESFKGYKSVGTPKSTFREGNATVQFGPVPADAIYNTTTNEPNPYNHTVTKRSLEGQRSKRSKKLFKPTPEMRKARRQFIETGSGL
ncbi:hypothetical protein B0A55_01618 [Friedmanniomyces simplex]|uniref:Uncharacterized protein n=1 Tax=Friedmanniomyces simplex TaxID=329884 RepID=A0A4V5NKG1_9PEZI|nr:hypothetical protein B0A55_01618 [Friedmanniomyces simplex]